MHRDRISPSELGTFSSCQMKWFISYILGIREPSGMGAVRGSIVHSVLEAVAKHVLLKQNRKRSTEDKACGKITRKLNTNTWFDNAWRFYQETNSHLEFTDQDKKICKSNINKVLDHEFSPLNLHEIIAPELEFKIEIPKEWAKFTKDNEEQTLFIKGFVDVVFRDKNGKIHYIDYKTQAKDSDFNTGEKITYDYLHKNTQMVIYNWAIKNEFVDEDHITGHIWYMAFNKLYTLSIDDIDIENIWNKINKQIEDMRNLSQPSVLYETQPDMKWKCQYVCPFSKNKFEEDKNWLNIEYNPIKHNFNPVDGKASICDTIKTFTKHRSLEVIVENFKK